MAHNRMKRPSVRERILSTATRLFYRQGIRSTGVNQIIRESQVAKASFYQYFPSKDRLILACLDEYDAALSKALIRMSGGCQGVTEFFKKWTRLIKKNADNNAFFMGCPVANLGFQVDPGNETLTKKFDQIIDGWFAVLEPLFKKSMEKKEISAGTDLKRLFGEIFAVNEGALLMWRLTGKREYLDNIYHAVQRLMAPS